MKKQLRQYQSEAISVVLSKLQAGVKRQILSFATGLGKSITAAEITNHFARCLWITDSEELIEQSSGVLASHTGKACGIIKQERCEINNPIVVASIQTLWRRLDRIPSNHFDLIIVDECHLAASRSFVQALSHFTPRLLLGLSATPQRADGLSLANIFDEITVEKDLQWGIENKFLCELESIRIQTNIDINKVGTLGGEFNQKDLAILDCPYRNNLIVNKWLQYAKDRPTISFCIDVEHAKNMTEAFRERGVSSEFVVGDKKLCPNREEIIADFKAGKISVLNNVNVLTKGFDSPDTSCILMARPTKSIVMYLQCLGRGSRLKSNGGSCIILDIVDNTTRHNLINTWSLDAGKPTEEKTFLSKQQKLKLIEARQKRTLESEIEKDVHVQLFKIPKFIINPSPKMREEATPAQMQWLASLGYDTINSSYTKGQCSEIISALPASVKDIRTLERYGYDTSKGNITVGEFQFAIKELQKKKVNIMPEVKTPFIGLK